MSATLRAVIFDLDSTLTCRPSTMKQAAKHLAAVYSDYLQPDCMPELENVLRSADRHGYRPRRDFFIEVFDAPFWRRKPEIEELLNWWIYRFGECNVLHDEAQPLLAELRQRGLKLGIITNGPGITQNSKLKQLAIGPLFDHIVIGGEFGVEKPDPSIFRHSCEALGVSPTEAVFVGDHAENDVVGAESAGLRAVWITTGGPWPKHLAQPDRQIGSLSELVGVLDSM